MWTPQQHGEFYKAAEQRKQQALQRRGVATAAKVVQGPLQGSTQPKVSLVLSAKNCIDFLYRVNHSISYTSTVVYP